MRIEQCFEVAAPRSQVWRLLRDQQQMMACVPGCRVVSSLGEDKYRADVEIAVGPIKARFALDIEITEAQPPELMRCSAAGEEGSRASLLQSTSVVQLEEIDPGTTRVRYSTELAITGRLGKFGLGMMKKIASRQAQEFERAFIERAEAMTTA